MKSDTIIERMSFTIAVGMVCFIRSIEASRIDPSMHMRLLRSAPSIGAHVEEAIAGHSLADFSHKLRIAYSKTRETRYWLHVLSEAGVCAEQMEQFALQAEELCRIIGAITKTNKTKSATAKSKIRTLDKN